MSFACFGLGDRGWKIVCSPLSAFALIYFRVPLRMAAFWAIYTRLTPSMASVPAWNLMMVASLLALLPPIAVVLGLQRRFVKGLIETEQEPP